MSNPNFDEPQAGPSNAPQYDMALVPIDHQFQEPQPGPSNAMPNHSLSRRGSNRSSPPANDRRGHR